MTNDSPAAQDLTRALQALARVQTRWLEDVRSMCAGDPRFLDAFRRWEEALTLLKVYLHRIEAKLLHLLLVPPERRPWKELPPSTKPGPAGYAHWNQVISPYFKALHIDTTYRRLADCLDLDGEALTADAVTDLVAIAEICDSTSRALERLGAIENDPAYLEDLAFFHVLSPWKQQGLPALFDFLRWLNAFLSERDSL